MAGAPKWIDADWPVPPGVRAVFTTRVGGCSQSPYDSFNLALHVGDVPARVERNRQLLVQALDLPAEPVWLEQVHGRRVLELDSASAVSEVPPEADGCWSRESGRVCAVMVADCLPVLLAERGGEAVAALHAGWRGLLDGVLDEAVWQLGRAGFAPDRLQAWLGPCIGQNAFEIGPEVRQAFLARAPADAASFRPGRGDRWHADLQALARARLVRLGLRQVFSTGQCTHAGSRDWFSFRRDGVTGRMAALIWREQGA